MYFSCLVYFDFLDVTVGVNSMKTSYGRMRKVFHEFEDVAGNRENGQLKFTGKIK